MSAWVVSAAATSTATGLDPANRPWFFLLAVPAQLGGEVIVSTVLASWYFGLAALPPWAGRVLKSAQASRPTRVPPLNRPSPLRTLATALGLAVGGSFWVLMAVPIQAMLTTWLLARPELYSGPERVAVGLETAAVIGWLAYLVLWLWRNR